MENSSNPKNSLRNSFLIYHLARQEYDALTPVPHALEDCQDLSEKLEHLLNILSIHRQRAELYKETIKKNHQRFVDRHDSHSLYREIQKTTKEMIRNRDLKIFLGSYLNELKKRYKTATYKVKDYDDISALKEIPIANFITSEIRNNQTVCPFADHDDSTPSFRIYKSSNSYYCFGCKKGGDNIDFIQNLYGKDFKGAIEILKSNSSHH